MTKILFVCHGNICQIPMAKFVPKQKALEQGVSLLRNGKRKTV